MQASLTSASATPWCAYYDPVTTEWKSNGLVIGSTSAQQVSDASESNSSEVEVSRIPYHLSDFAVSTTDSDRVFVPIELVRRTTGCLLLRTLYLDGIFSEQINVNG